MNPLLSDTDAKAIETILCQQLALKPDQLKPDARIMADLQADSLDVVEICMALEERFNLVIPDDEWERAETVEHLQALVAEKLQPAGRAE